MKKTFYNKLTKVVLFFVLLPVSLFAQSGGGGTVVNETIKNPIKSTTIMGLLSEILKIVLQIGMPIIVLAFMYSGFLFVKARGNPAELVVAKTALTYTAIGAAVLIGASALAKLLEGTVGLF